MTRIIAGRAGGRRLAVPPRGTRPTSDRVREALFSALVADRGLDGAAVLDLCAGSGALGLEALSRGAAHALFVESDRRAADVLRRNIADLGLAGAAVRAAPAATVLADPADRAYDLVLADPPYDTPDTEVAGWLAAAAAHGWLAQDVTVVVERSAHSGGAEPNNRSSVGAEARGRSAAGAEPNSRGASGKARQMATFPWPAPLQAVRERRYGDTVLHTARGASAHPE